jgi:hypothetical protein
MADDCSIMHSILWDPQFRVCIRACLCLFASWQPEQVSFSELWELDLEDLDLCFRLCLILSDSTQHPPSSWQTFGMWSISTRMTKVASCKLLMVTPF